MAKYKNIVLLFTGITIALAGFSYNFTGDYALCILGGGLTGWNGAELLFGDKE